MNRKTGFCFLALVLLLLSLVGCGTTAPPETQPPTEDPNLKVVEYTLTAEKEEDLLVLADYPNLQRVDLRGSSCYEAIMAYMEAHPQVQVQYDVKIGNTLYQFDMQELTLEDGTFDAAQLLENLKFLPQLQKLELPRTSLDANILTQLNELYPDLEIGYTVLILEQEVSGNVTELDLSGLLPEQVETVCPEIAKLGNLTDIYLMDGEGKSALGMTDVKLLMDAVPETNVHYSFKLFGQTLTTMDERVEYVKNYFGNEGVEQIRQALDILPKCTYLLMDRCNVSNEVMAQLRDDYPDVKVVWRIYFDKYNCLTDVTVFQCVETLHDGNSKQIKYCTDVVYLDIGHSYNLSDLSFVSYMPNLKVAIVADCYTKTLEPFAACKNLQWLEIVNCNRVTDLSPLANCTNLRGVNMSYTFTIDDLSPLYGLEHLERLFLGRHDLPQEEIDAVRAALPNCWVTDESWDVAWIGFNYSVGWRLDDEHTFADWYLEIKEVFGYTREI